MLISGKSSSELASKLAVRKEVFCKGLFLSARWFVVSQTAKKGTHVIVLPDKESAEYCASDLYDLVEGDIVFYLPDSGKVVEKSNFKSSVGVQRTSAIGKLISNKSNSQRLFIVTYPDALKERIPSANIIQKSLLTIKKEEEISHDKIKEILVSQGFEKTDFVSAPGQFSIRGSIIDVFSFSYNYPFRISFFGDEVEKIHVFDCNTQLSKEERDQIEIFPDLSSNSEENLISISDLFPEESVIWADSSDMYRREDFFKEMDKFKKVFLEVPLEVDNDDVIKFDISPQPVFNKNFELLSADLAKKIEGGYKVFIFSEKKSQIDRLFSILKENKGLLPEFVQGKNIHAGFVDNQEKVCCYSDIRPFPQGKRKKNS